MDINLNDLHNKDVESLHLDGELQLDSLDINGRDIKLTSPIKYEGDIYKVGRDKLVHLNIYYNYQEACGRCLDLFENKDKAVLSGKLAEKFELDNEEEEDNLIYYNGDKLNLTEEIIETIILNLPMKPLCSEKCKGLCPECGTNLNEDQCNCESDYVDPRFEKLKELFSEE
ncbi:MAG: DUF177 domain-containing protein [Tissierellia bacterium]|nr:DUF177 domain-containing protein [Tissierellia bacterium]